MPPGAPRSPTSRSGPTSAASFDVSGSSSPTSTVSPASAASDTGPGGCCRRTRRRSKSRAVRPAARPTSQPRRSPPGRFARASTSSVPDTATARPPATTASRHVSHLHPAPPPPPALNSERASEPADGGGLGVPGAGPESIGRAPRPPLPSPGSSARGCGAAATRTAGSADASTGVARGPFPLLPSRPSPPASPAAPPSQPGPGACAAEAPALCGPLASESLSGPAAAETPPACGGSESRPAPVGPELELAARDSDGPGATRSAWPAAAPRQAPPVISWAAGGRRSRSSSRAVRPAAMAAYQPRRSSRSATCAVPARAATRHPATAASRHAPQTCAPLAARACGGTISGGARGPAGPAADGARDVAGGGVWARGGLAP
jgi:hypothetical protein